MNSLHNSKTASSKFDQVINLAKRRGFIYPSSEIYGGLANSYDYGPLGVEVLRQLRNHWWDFFVSRRPEIYGLETSILMNPKVWEASGHTRNFSDIMVDCRHCHQRTRADHLIENYFKQKGQTVTVEGQSAAQLDRLIVKQHIPCPVCQKFLWTPARAFNLLFQTHVGIVPENQSLTYLRGETAQGMFADFKLVLDTLSPKLPFGLAQSGKVFRNEITLGQQVFRTLEFDLAEFEYFIQPPDWQPQFAFWKGEIERFAASLGIAPAHLRWRPHTPDELAFYSTRTEDLEYKFPFGFKEWYAIAYRTDYDLKNHMEKSGVDLRYTDPVSGAKYIPHVIEPTFGISRSVLVILTEAYWFDRRKQRSVLRLKPFLTPYKIAVFPLLANKPQLVDKARQVYAMLSPSWVVAFDERGNIGKRYFAQDEIGTPFCVTIDFDTLKDDSVTVRDRDTTRQERVSLAKLPAWFTRKLK